MINYLSTTQRSVTEKYINFFQKGIPSSQIDKYENILKKNNIASITMFGILRGTNLLYEHCVKNTVPFYYMDRPYWGESRMHPHWLRIVKNNHVKNIAERRHDDRYKKTFPFDVKSYHRSGKKIMVCPPTDSISVFFNCADWLERTLATLKQHTDREIIIRDKPYNPQALKGTDGVIHAGRNKTRTNDEKIEWKDIHAVVTFNSSITIKALANGVPVFTDKNNCAYPVAENDFTKIETPRYEDPMPLFYSLAYGQFTAEEMSNGYAWRILNES
jgi:hypothetical protein